MIVGGVEIREPRPVGGGDICRAYRGRAGDRDVFVKTLPDAPAGFFETEADALDWLRVEGGPSVPAVVAVDESGLVLEWVDPAAPSRAAAESFGRALATMHAQSPASFGRERDGFIGSLPLPNSAAAEWPTFYVERRIEPYLAALDTEERRAVELVCARIGEVAGPPEPPARIHGDLWSGNVLWSAAGSAALIDAAAAHGGHRETDLAMLALFGAPFLDTILAAYDDVSPLADGWRRRVPLHQLHPLLVHARLFGGGYGARAAAAARALLAG